MAPASRQRAPSLLLIQYLIYYCYMCPRRRYERRVRERLSEIEERVNALARGTAVNLRSGASVAGRADVYAEPYLLQMLC